MRFRRVSVVLAAVAVAIGLSPVASAAAKEPSWHTVGAFRTSAQCAAARGADAAAGHPVDPPVTAPCSVILGWPAFWYYRVYS